MDTPIVVTFLICGTLIVITLVAILFAMWVINKGVEFENDRKK